jgi:hypothetical protein
MPSVQSFTDYFTALFERRLHRADQRDAAAAVLPADFSGAVFTRARELAAEIDAALAALEPEIARARADLQAAEKQVAATRPRILSATRQRGDVLTKFSIEPGKPTSAAVTTSATIKARKQLVEPLRQLLQALERQRWLLEQERSQLKKIALRAGAGDVSLVIFLSDHWRSKLLIGPAALGKLPKAARELLGTTIYVDSQGNPLPAEALTEEGKPDLPAAGLVPR